MAFNYDVRTRPPRKASVPKGNHLAICCGLIEMGTQHDTWKGEEKVMRKIRILWEVPKFRIKFQDKRTGREVEKPAWVGQDYTLSFSDKAKLRPVVEAHGIEIPEKGAVPLERMIGVGVQIKITHNESEDGSQWEHVDTVAGLLEGTPVPALEAEPLLYQILDDHGNVIEPGDRIPDFVKKKIQASDEYRGVRAQPAVDEPPVARNSADEVPF